MGKSVRQTQAEIDSAEFAEWNAYFQIEPFGATDLNTHFASLIAALVNVNRGEKDERVEPKDFMLGRKQDELDDEEEADLIFMKIRAWAEGLKG